MRAHCPRSRWVAFHAPLRRRAGRPACATRNRSGRCEASRLLLLVRGVAQDFEQVSIAGWSGVSTDIYTSLYFKPALLFRAPLFVRRPAGAVRESIDNFRRCGYTLWKVATWGTVDGSLDSRNEKPPVEVFETRADGEGRGDHGPREAGGAVDVGAADGRGNRGRGDRADQCAAVGAAGLRRQSQGGKASYPLETGRQACLGYRA